MPVDTKWPWDCQKDQLESPNVGGGGKNLLNVAVDHNRCDRVLLGVIEVVALCDEQS